MDRDHSLPPRGDLNDRVWEREFAAVGEVLAGRLRHEIITERADAAALRKRAGRY